MRRRRRRRKKKRKRRRTRRRHTRPLLSHLKATKCSPRVVRSWRATTSDASAMGRGEPLRQASGDHLEAEAARQSAEHEAWDAFRAAHPARFATQPLAGQPWKRPKESEQEDWVVYTARGSATKIYQQHLVVPGLVPHTLSGPTPPVYGISDTEPFQAPDSAREHVTNIARMEALVARTPGGGPGHEV